MSALVMKMRANLDAARKAAQDARSSAKTARKAARDKRDEINELDEVEPDGPEMKSLEQLVASRDDAEEKAEAAEEEARKAEKAWETAVKSDAAGSEDLGADDVDDDDADLGGGGTKSRTHIDRIIVGDGLKAARQMGGKGKHQLGELATPAEVKTLLTGTGAAPGSSTSPFARIGRKPYIELPERKPTFLDLIRVEETDDPSIEYARMVTRPTQAAFTAEATATNNGEKPEGAFSFEKVTETAEAIPVFLPVARRALKNDGQMRGILERGLTHNVRRVMEDQALAGDGNGANLLGVLNQPGINSYEIGTDDVDENEMDALLSGITTVLMDDEEANGALVNPLDWAAMKKKRDGSGGDPDTGGYLLGAPNQPGSRELWDVPFLPSRAIPQGQALVGDFSSVVLYLWGPLETYITDSHSDWFKRNILALLIEQYALITVERPAALCVVSLEPEAT